MIFLQAKFEISGSASGIGYQVFLVILFNPYYSQDGLKPEFISSGLIPTLRLGLAMNPVKTGL